MLTDFAQFIVQFGITLLFVPMVLHRVGGISGLYQQMPLDQRGLFSAQVSPTFLFVYLFVIILSYNGGTWGLAQRFISIGKPREARKAAFFFRRVVSFLSAGGFYPMWAAHSLLGPGGKHRTYLHAGGSKDTARHRTRFAGIDDRFHVRFNHVHARYRYSRNVDGFHTRHLSPFF